ncbi:hypothetical protein ACTWJ9_33145 (plasmid) [Streptomyces sp. GDS52]|uniref:hypothetical protein n=1 Tax=Streptomyces sp. GDS52 TaxID=3406419 RepID=UPI003FCF4F07
MTEPSENVREHVYRLLFEDLNLCCGLPEDSYDLVRDLLTAFRTKTDIDTLLPDHGARYLVLGALDNAGLIEHSSIIDAAWLTRKGEWYWQALTRFDSDDIDGGAEGIGLPHDGTPCTDACLKPFWGLS